MTLGPCDVPAALAAIAEQLAAAYELLLKLDDPALEPGREAVFGALAALDRLASGLTAPSVRATLDPP